MSITIILLIITCLVSYQAFRKEAFFYRFAHWPIKEHGNKEYFRLLSSGFVHANWLHLLINMFVFWQFGEYIESNFTILFGVTLGRIYYLLVFVLTIILANIPTYLNKKDEPAFLSVGASGAVSGIVFIFILLDPWSPLYLYGIIKIPGIIAGVLFLVYSSWASKRKADRIDHVAHFAGAIAGVLLTILLKPALISHFIERLTTDSPF